MLWLASAAKYKDQSVSYRQKESHVMLVGLLDTTVKLTSVAENAAC